MENNVGSTDQAVRITIGALMGLSSIAILAGYLDVEELLSPVLGVLSVVLLATAYTGKCGLYNLLGINTCKVE